MSIIDIKKETFHRLSKNVIPIHYEILIAPDLESFKFSGKVAINLKVLEQTNYIELHSLELSLGKIELSCSTNEIVKVIQIEKSKINESVIFVLEKPIEIGTAKLSIEFDGVINESSNGFYKNKCLSRDGNVIFSAATQFEPAYARKAFPCFDEPSFKATFDITIVGDKNKTVLSNMPVKKFVENQDGSKATWHFETTPIMSTYLVAYVIGDYDYVEKVSDEGTLVRIYTPVGMSHLGQFSLELSIKALRFFTKYFDIGYVLPKLDLIGLTYVDIEAMENYGLLVFKESLLLIDPNNCSVHGLAEAALVICHEIAHQWFGNLVTMEWWTDLWLNEGFATYVEYVCVDACFPEWNVWNLYATDHLYRAYSLDSLTSSHPIEVPVNAPSELDQIFDSISYCKGSSVLRMLNDYIGFDSFIAGLRSYLKKFKFSNATSEDLWDEMDKAAPSMNVKRLMQVWTKEQGYPLIKVCKRKDPKTNHTILTLEQSRFSKSSKNADEKEIIWNIPISVVTKSNGLKLKTLMDRKLFEIDIGAIEETDWIKINNENVGFYLVEYSNDLSEQLIKALNPSDRFSTPLDRFGILNDAFSLVISGRIQAAILMDLIWQFREETNSYVWITLIKNLEWLLRCFINLDFYSDFKEFLRRFFLTIKSKIGFEIKPDENNQEKLLRGDILHMLAKIEDAEFNQFAQDQFMNRDKKRIHADLQKSIYTSVIQNGDKQTVEEFIEMYKSCSTPEEKERIALLLGEVRNPQLIEQVLNFAISDIVTLEETIFILVSVACNSTSVDSTKMTWEFLKENWPLIYSRYSESALLGRLLKKSLENFTSLEFRSQIEEFFAINEAPQATFAIKQAIESIEINSLFLTTQRKLLEDYFHSKI